MRRNRRLWNGCRVGVLALGFLALACASKTPVEAPAVARQPLPAEKPPLYRLQVGDQIAIKFWGSPELDQELKIRPDGRISLPFIDEVEAAGLTPAELDAQLTQAYTGELAQPDITVIVREAGGQEIYIGGEVKNQGAFEFRGQLSLYQAIQQAGGFLPTARRHQVLVIRTTSDGERLAAAVDLMPVVSGQDPDADLALQPADIIFVPRAKIINVTTFLQRYFYDLLPIRVVGTVRLEDIFDDETPAEEPTNDEFP